MGLFNFGKKKEAQEPACACNVPVEETKEESCCCCGSNTADAETGNCCSNDVVARRAMNFMRIQRKQ